MEGPPIGMEALARIPVPVCTVFKLEAILAIVPSKNTISVYPFHDGSYADHVPIFLEMIFNRCCACFDYGVVLPDNECNTPGDCCTTFGGTHSVGAGSCGDSSASRTYACLGSKGTIGTNSCNGLVACKRQRNEIGDESCNGVYACPFRSGNVGNASCVGYKACYGGYDATIGNGSCNGSDACKQRNEVQIGDGSCNCQE